MSLTVVSNEDGGVAALDCADDMNALEMSGDFKEMEKLLGDTWASRQVALGFGATEYIDSAAIGWLLSLHKAIGEGGGKLVLHSMNPSVARVLKMMRIDNVLTVAENQAQAEQLLKEGK